MDNLILGALSLCYLQWEMLVPVRTESEASLPVAAPDEEIPRSVDRGLVAQPAVDSRHAAVAEQLQKI